MLIVLWSTALQVNTCRQTMKPQINQPIVFYDKSCYFWLALYSSSWLNNIRELTDRFHVAMHLFSNRSQMVSKCGENKKRGTQATTRCVTDVLIAVFLSSVICYWTDPWKQDICLIILWCHGIIQHIIHMLVVFIQSCIVVVWVLQLQLVVQFYKIALLVYVTVNNYKLYFCLITACSNFGEDTKESCYVRIFSWARCFWNKRSIHAGRITDWFVVLFFIRVNLWALTICVIVSFWALTVQVIILLSVDYNQFLWWCFILFFCR